MFDPVTKIEMPEAFVKLVLVTNMHLGGVKLSKKMKEYVYSDRPDGLKVFDIQKMWSKFVLAARVIAGQEISKNVCLISCKTFAQKAIYRFSMLHNSSMFSGRFIPGTFTNTTVSKSFYPRVAVISDPNTDAQALLESTTVNCPVIAFCNTDANVQFVDVAIPVNNRSPQAIGASYFILSRLVSFMLKGRPLDDEMKHVELFFYRHPFELERIQEEQNTEEIAAEKLIEEKKNDVADIQKIKESLF